MTRKVLTKGIRTGDVYSLPHPISAHFSRNGFRYYACIVDDHTWFTWLIPLKVKFDFF